MQEQSYANHGKMVPLFHYVLAALILLAFIGSMVNLYQALHNQTDRRVAVILAVLCTAAILQYWYSRTFPLKAQDRAIRAEEQIRHFVLTGKPLDRRLTMKQIIGLRFASDIEFPELARKAAETSLSQKEIKKCVKSWRPDHDRL